jgi:hypothetical protein
MSTRVNEQRAACTTGPALSERSRSPDGVEEAMG